MAQNVDSNSIWHVDKKDAWVLGIRLGEEVVTDKYDKSKSKVIVKVKTKRRGDKKFDQEQETCIFNPAHLGDFENISDMNGLNAASLVNVLRRRFEHEDSSTKSGRKPYPYTYVSDVILAVNPYAGYPHLYPSADPKEGYLSNPTKHPHLRAIADFAVRDMKENDANQAIIVSGESGAGKTFSCGLVLKRLTELSDIAGNLFNRQQKTRAVAKPEDTEKLPLRTRIQQVGLLLEAFGNAKTVRNDNSSRFGKYLKIYWNRDSNMMTGAYMEKYMLEKTRVVTLDQGHRNYHIFYWMLKGIKDPAKRRELELMPMENYNYLNQNDFKLDAKGKRTKDRKSASKCGGNYLVFAMNDDGTPQSVSPSERTTLDPKKWDKESGFKLAMNDEEEFGNITQYFSDSFGPKLGATYLMNVFRISSGILRLGNIDFEDSGTPTKASADHAASAAKLLGLSDFSHGNLSIAERLHYMVRSTFEAGHIPDFLSSPQKGATARGYRDALAKTIYGRLFDQVFIWCNKTLKEPEMSVRYDRIIGMLDIFGFEIFKVNGFEQMCINYCNEKLQQTFNNHFFKKELEDYEREGLHTENIKPVDNSDTVYLVEAGYGFGIIDSLCDKSQQKSATDFEFGDKMAGAYIRNQKKLKGRKLRASKRFDNIGPADLGLGSKKAWKFNDYANPKLRRQNYKNAKPFKKGEFFVIYHFAGPVDYRVNNFLDRNKDELPLHLTYLMGLSTNEMMQNLFPEAKKILNDWNNKPNAERHVITWLKTNEEPAKKKVKDYVPLRRKKKGTSGYVGKYFQNQLESLMDDELDKAQPHYIRCIKSNDFRLKAHEKNSFCAPLVLRQLLYAGVLEVVAIRRKGYPYRKTIDQFWLDCKAKNLTGLAGVSNSLSAREGITAVLTAITGKPPVPRNVPEGTVLDMGNFGPYTIGEQTVFGKDNLKAIIDKWRTDNAMEQIQPWGRFYIIHCRYRRFAWAVEKMQNEWRETLLQRKAKYIGPLLVEARRLARAVVGVQSLKDRRKYATQKKIFKKSWTSVQRAVASNCAYQDWSAVVVQYMKLIQQRRALVKVQRAHKNYDAYVNWFKVASKKMVGKKMSDASERIAANYRAYQAYEDWFNLEVGFRHYANDESFKLVQKFVRKKLRNSRMIGKARKAKAALKSRHRVAAACVQIQTLIRAAAARTQLKIRVVSKGNASNLMDKLGSMVTYKIRLKRFMKMKDLRKQRRSLNHIIRALQLWDFEHQWAEKRKSALAIQAWYYYWKHYKGTLNEWRKDIEGATLNGRVGDLQQSLLATDKRWAPLKRFTNLVNMRSRVRQTTLLYTCICADAEESKIQLMAQFLMDCGATVLSPNYFRKPAWLIKEDTPIHAAVDCGDVKLSLAKFLVAYAALHGENKKDIMTKKNTYDYTLVDTCIEGTPTVPSEHYMTLMWLLGNGSRPSDQWKMLCIKQVHDIKKSPANEMIRRIANAKVRDRDMVKTKAGAKFKENKKQMLAPIVTRVGSDGKASTVNSMTGKEVRRSVVFGSTPRSLVQSNTGRNNQAAQHSRKLRRPTQLYLKEQRQTNRWAQLTRERKEQIAVHQLIQSIPEDAHGAAWLTRALLAYRHMEASQKERGWYYKDAKDVVRGPYPAETMNAWFKGRFFSSKTFVRYGDHGLFMGIADYFPGLKDYFPTENNIPRDLMMALGSLYHQADAPSLNEKYPTKEDYEQDMD